ncbi:MAG TPA: TonB-dependent receptor [Arachidicoccus sp.]|nr:TonB-dependent receptor [Arachidicoccus sp.]
MKKLFSLLVCVVIFAGFYSTPVQAQSGQALNFSGWVVNETAMPVDGATIEWTNLQTNATGHLTTDHEGRFSIPVTSGSRWQIKISYVGYTISMERVAIRQQSKEQRFIIQPQLGQLTPLEVRSIRAGDHAPFAKTNITAAEIKTKNLGRDLPYLLEQTPNVVINSDAGNGIGYTGIHIRGSDGTRTNVTLNGIPYNDAESSGSFFVDMPDMGSSLGSIQIQRGIGTSSNGAGAFGATINLSTNEVHELPYVSLSNSAGSYNSWKNTVSAGSGLIDGKFTADVRLSHVSSNGYIERAASDLQSLLFSTAYIGKKTTLRFNFITGKEKTYQAWNGVPAIIIDSIRNYNELGQKSDGTYYSDQTDNYTQTHYQFFITHVFNDKWSFNLASFLTRGKGYYEEYEIGAEYADYGFTNPDTTSTDLVRRKFLDNYFYGQTFSVQYKKAGDMIHLGGSWTNYDGGHYGQVIWTQNGGIPKDAKYYDVPAYKYDKNIYLKWMHDFGPYWHLFTDIQYRNVWHKMNGFKDNPDLHIKRKFDFINPKIGVSFAKSGYNGYFSYALAGKEPSRDDFEAGQTHQPDREQLHDFELGIEKKTARYFWSANLYYMLYKDQLVLTGALNDVGSATRINVPNSYRAGIELQGGYEFSDWMNVKANIAFSRNKIDKFTAYYPNYDADWNSLDQIAEQVKNTDIAYSPNVVGAISLNIKPVNEVTISLDAKYVGKQFLDNTENKDRQLAGYYNQDLRVSYQLKGKWLKNVQLIGQIYNIFNTYYNTNGATYPEYDNGAINNYLYYFPAAPTHFMIGLNLDL